MTRPKIRRFEQTRNLLNPADIATLVYLLVTLIYILISLERIPHPGYHIWTRIIMISVMGMLIYAPEKYNSPLLKFLRDLYPLLFLAFFFNETDAINNIFFANFDPWLANADKHIFGFMPSEVLSKRWPQPWISELLYFGYFSFYLIIIFFVFGYYYFLPELFPSRFFIFLQSFYLFYLIFILFPSAGPQYFITGPGTEVIPQGTIGRMVHMILRLGDRPTGAFPSSHIGMTWLIMFIFAMDKKRWFIIWLVPALLLTLGTVYIRAHYAVDVIGGLVTAVFLYYTGLYIAKSFIPLHTPPDSIPVQE
ncbi:MAG: phosphatase PAP2 family protein [Chlorobi bacterium]|nr:phosphatase PAP2 family protein [Chlorobiota bacterium]